jgi:hypothetical protein
MATLSFNEIKDGAHFEDLVVAYFNSKLIEPLSGISSVSGRHSGLGPDGGTDILIEFRLTDTISEFSRKWVVQCKFHSRNISPTSLNDNNIPSLIHSHNADGYLLICKEKPTVKLTNLFEQLNTNCKFKYRYTIWSGEVFKSQLLVAHDTVRKQFFPKFYKKEIRLSIK